VGIGVGRAGRACDVEEEWQRGVHPRHLWVRKNTAQLVPLVYTMTPLQS
jgi:hypothetical protein